MGLGFSVLSESTRDHDKPAPDAHEGSRHWQETKC